tara:strand:+ start:857 stop:1645 length:789 start_codon:yes stop_codon:yes gene_type:complete
MGLLEKAGKKKDDVVPKKAAAKAKKAASVKPVKAAKKAKPAKEKKTREPRERKEREARVMPDGYKLAGKAARFARRLVDFIVTYGAFLGVFTAFAMIDGDFTYMWLAAIAMMLLNLVILPAKTHRTVGMFLTRTRYVNSKGNHPNSIHQIISSLTALYIILSLTFVGIGAAETGGANWTLISIGIVLGLIPFTDYVITKLRAANGETQSMYDALFGCWFVVAERTETEGGSRWMSRLESLGDWGEKRGWSGSAEEEDAENND